MKRNYKDDFDFIMRLYSAMVDSCGREVGDSRRELGWPDYDWVATFYTSSKANAYVASCIGGECVNCYNDNGQIHIVVNSHHMGPGRLKVEFRAELPRDIYPDGYQRNVIPEPLDIELIVGKGDLPSEMEVELLLPYIKGDAFTYADFTSEQIADLKRPATEAAERLDSFVRTASEAETTRVSNEKSRVNAESTRVSQEESRVGAEEIRVADETKRREAEAERAKAEEARKTAEAKRATEFASWETELDGKAEKSELSNIIGTPTEEKIEDIEPTLVTEALRKVPQVLTPEEQAQVKANLAISKMELFDDMWRVAVGVWGDIDHSHMEDGVNKPYYLNELWLTYEEAVKTHEISGIYSNALDYRFFSSKLRTHLPKKNGILTSSNNHANRMYYSCPNLEVVTTASVESLSESSDNSLYIPPLTIVFDSCSKLRKVIGRLMMYQATYTRISTPIINCPNLEDVKFYNMATGTGGGLNIGTLSKLNLASMQYLIASAFGGTAKATTITVHPSVYSKLTDETNTEWHKVLLDAAEKNITFATT